jgi:hypothetical protein
LAFFDGASEEDEDEDEDEDEGVLTSCFLFKLLLVFAPPIVSVCQIASLVVNGYVESESRALTYLPQFTFTFTYEFRHSNLI